MNYFAELFSRLMTPTELAEEKPRTLRMKESQMSTQSRNVTALPPDRTREKASFPKDIYSLGPTEFQSMVQGQSKKSLSLQYPPCITLQCANVQATKYTLCDKSGTMACSACKLVSYCSKECQKAHWKLHKQDCKNLMMSKDWEPSWVKEHRQPMFIEDESESPGRRLQRTQMEEFTSGMALWGNMPATDVINLSCNEDNAKKDFSIAFIASGDLRNVVRTLNGLPSDYSGHLNILLNDFNPLIFSRNIVLLLILANVPDESIAADMALHFWYSIFMPAEYRTLLSAIIQSFLQKNSQGHLTVTLGPRSKLSTTFLNETAKIFLHFANSSLSIGDIQDEYNRVRTAPCQRDFRDRMYLALRPAHRVAFQGFRSFGLVLPFGAVNAHFTCPNPSLFSLEGRWLQPDFADPLEGWDIQAIIKTGKAQGAHAEDIYGCLYFYLSRQLRTFAKCLRSFSSSFTVLNLDARLLPQMIRNSLLSEWDIPPSIKFDRIEVSNILDEDYVGLHDTLTLWAPFLQESKNAAIVGYFMNWTKSKDAPGLASASQLVLEDLLTKVLAKEKTVCNSVEDLIVCLRQRGALYENSKPFFKFLQKRGLDDILRQTSLRLRETHAIVPHRILAPLRGSPTALPKFVDDDARYTKLTNWTWSQRYVEFQHGT